MSISKKVLLAAVLAPTLMAGAVQAVEPGFYLGASGGQTYVDQDANDYGFNGNGNFKIDTDETGWKAYLGYNFLPWLGVEAGYVDFGSFSQNFNNGSSVDLDLDGWEGFLVGTLPLGPVDLFAKVGGIDVTSELDTKNFGTNSESDTKLAYGVGMAYNIGHWGLRVEAEGYDDNEVDDFYFVSAGVTYHFFSEKPAPVAATPVAEAPAACPDGDNDGVCDTADQCPKTPAGVRVDSIGCDCDYKLALEFAFDSAKLSSNDMAQLDDVAAALKNNSGSSIGGVINGYTDSVGTDSYNLGLSKRRAESVASYLQSKGVNVGGRFTVNGYGESDPVASNDTAEGRAQNRRVEVRRTDCK